MDSLSRERSQVTTPSRNDLNNIFTDCRSWLLKSRNAQQRRTKHTTAAVSLSEVYRSRRFQTRKMVLCSVITPLLNKLVGLTLQMWPIFPSNRGIFSPIAAWWVDEKRILNKLYIHILPRTCLLMTLAYLMGTGGSTRSDERKTITHYYNVGEKPRCIQHGGRVKSE